MAFIILPETIIQLPWSSTINGKSKNFSVIIQQIIIKIFENIQG
jgi:hypothetical protein